MYNNESLEKNIPRRQKNDKISHITHSINYFAQKVTEQNIELEKLFLLDDLTTFLTDVLLI